ncbi:YhjD/YihY/BrkB family envelope integrity protein [Candidatus Riflebacteria bacterium]
MAKIVVVLQKIVQFLKKILQFLKRLRFFRILYRAGIRFDRDLCFTRAASMAYTTLVSMIPAATLGALFFTNFQTGQDILNKLKTFLYNHTIPASAEKIKVYLSQYSANTTAVNIVGFTSLIVTALLLVNTVERTLNDIWRSPENRPFLKKVSFFWSFVTLTPFCLGFSIYYTARIESMDLMAEILKIDFIRYLFTLTIPIGFAVVAFFTLYYLIPYSQVSVRACLLGAFVAASFWEIAKQLFNYTVNVAYYDIIYGSIGIIPIFLLWLYLTWTIILYGAEVAVVFQYHEDESGGDSEFEGFFLLSILNFLAGAYEMDERPVSFDDISRSIKITQGDTRKFLNLLIQARLITESKEGRLILNYAPDHLNLYEIFSRLRINFFNIPEDIVEDEYVGQLKEIQNTVRDYYFNELSKISLKDLKKKTLKVIPSNVKPITKI